VRRFLAGFAAALVLVIAPFAIGAPSGDQTIKGSLTVNGDTFTRSVQSFGPTISNFADVYAGHATSAHVSIAQGGNGYDWLDQNGTPTTRIMAGSYTADSLPNLPASSLVLARDGTTAALWFKTCDDQMCWTRLTP
jgi:hypothetical protein